MKIKRRRYDDSRTTVITVCLYDRDIQDARQLSPLSLRIIENQDAPVMDTLHALMILKYRQEQEEASA